jgi:hypothetical protein
VDCKRQDTVMNSKELLKLKQNFGAGRGSNLTDAAMQHMILISWVDYFFNQSTSQNHNFSIQNNSKI